jgi:hypothetical protein
MVNDIAQCQQIISDLEAKLARVKARSGEISAERDSVSFAAHTGGDHKARAKLDRLIEEAYKQTGEIASLEAALKTAREHLAETEHAAATAEDRKQAKQAKEIADKIGARMKRAHAALTNGFDELAAVVQELDQLNALGVTHPNHNVLRVTPASAFAKLFEENLTVRQAHQLTKAVPPTLYFEPLVTGGAGATFEAIDNTTQSEAYRQLEDMARKMAAQVPEMTTARAFERVLMDPTNAALARAALNPPQPEMAYAWPNFESSPERQ